MRMQPYALTVDKFLDHAAKWSGDREIVTADAGRPALRIGYAELRARSNRLSGALEALGLRGGERVRSLVWNTQHHLEMYYALMGSGIVCHTLNPRITVAHLAAMVNEAEDRVLAVGGGLSSLASELPPLCPSIEVVVILDGTEIHPQKIADCRTFAFETLLAELGDEARWGGFE